MKKLEKQAQGNGVIFSIGDKVIVARNSAYAGYTGTIQDCRNGNEILVLYAFKDVAEWISTLDVFKI